MHHSVPNAFHLLRKNTALLLVLLIFFLLRVPLVDKWLPFGDDAGRQLLAVAEYIEEQKIPLIGPPASLALNGKQFFHGPYEYYFMMPIQFFFNGNPLAVILAFIIWNAVGCVLLFITLKRIIPVWAAALLTSTAYSLPAVIPLTTAIWNPNLLLPVATFILFLLTSPWQQKWWSHLAIGFLIGVGILLHYQAIFWIPIYLAFLIAKKGWKHIPIAMVGGAIGGAPMLVFELRHQFYNTLTALSVLRSGADNQGTLTFAYAIGLLPFLTYALAYILTKTKKEKKTWWILPVLLWFCVVQVTNMTEWQSRWNVHYANQAAEWITQDSPSNFNIASLLTGDTQAHTVRYLVKQKGAQPRSQIEYTNLETLYVVTTTERDTTVSLPYEIEVFQGCLESEHQLGDSQFRVQRWSRSCAKE